ncbi:MAG TPA: bifunctional riboflavin kinase/FAD synthetase, partial [Motilibacterales bacterium]|nr:bifunctional riboflavin kinase/FAD synthetase [Motilibacterales bacterium]
MTDLTWQGMSMHVWRGCDEVPSDLAATAVTIGAFDGVHRGHRILLDRAVAAAAGGLLPVAVTFDPHPLSVIRPDMAPPLLTSMAHRLELFEEEGIGGVLIIQFTPELAAESAERFASRVLAGTLNSRHVVVGRNFRFGHRAAGDVALLTELGRELGFDVTVVDLEPLEALEAVSDTAEGPVAVSSTQIRAMVAGGDVVGAAGALGRRHRVSGPVVHGDHRGRELGYPTANVEVPDSMAVPGDGVYAGYFRASGEPGVWRPSAISVGTNPTFDGQTRRVEAYVLDDPEGYDVYGQWADVEFVDRIRPMARFDSIEGLVAQM